MASVVCDTHRLQHTHVLQERCRQELEQHAQVAENLLGAIATLVCARDCARVLVCALAFIGVCVCVRV